MFGIHVMVGLFGPLFAYAIPLCWDLVRNTYAMLFGERRALDAEDDDGDTPPAAWLAAGRRPGRRGERVHVVTAIFVLLLVAGNAMALAVFCTDHCPWRDVVLGGALAGVVIGRLFALVARSGYLLVPLLVLPFVINTATIWLVSRW
jgi:hypothetical protein